MLAAVAALFACTIAGAVPPLRTGVFDPAAFPANPALSFQRVKAAGASVVRLQVNWALIARQEPAGRAKAQSPLFPGYDWSSLDAQVKDAVARGLAPLLLVAGAPAWAADPAFSKSHSPTLPDTHSLSDFAHALAGRYSGDIPGIPRVSLYVFWNEPNLSTNLKPQTSVGIDWYRSALNAFASAVHGVKRNNIVAGGALAPFREKPRPGVVTYGLAPMTFMRTLLCMSASATPKSTCSTRVDVDAWDFHPYTYGAPTDHAYSPDDISMGDIPRAETLLRAAVSVGHLHANGPLRFWVTEFSWDTNPPDFDAVPIDVQARWTSEALYRLWADDVSIAMWFLLRDEPYPVDPFQSGLYFAGSTIEQDRPKPTLRAFRFPFVANLDGRSFALWGRTPDSKAATVAIELKSGSTWKRVLTLHAAPNGIFQGRWASPLRSGTVRARLTSGRDTSLPFALKAPPDLKISPFGG